jgi:hypothetical protein
VDHPDTVDVAGCGGHLNQDLRPLQDDLVSWTDSLHSSGNYLRILPLQVMLLTDGMCKRPRVPSGPFGKRGDKYAVD